MNPSPARRDACRESIDRLIGCNREAFISLPRDLHVEDVEPREGPPFIKNFAKQHCNVGEPLAHRGPDSY